MILEIQHTTEESVSKWTAGFDALGNFFIKYLYSGYLEFLKYFLLTPNSCMPVVHCLTTSQLYESRKGESKLLWSTTDKRKGLVERGLNLLDSVQYGLKDIYEASSPAVFLDVKHSSWKRECVEVSSCLSQQTPSTGRSASLLAQPHKWLGFLYIPQNFWQVWQIHDPKISSLLTASGLAAQELACSSTSHGREGSPRKWRLLDFGPHRCQQRDSVRSSLNVCFIAQQLPKCMGIGKKGDKGALINREEQGEKKLIKI